MLFAGIDEYARTKYDGYAVRAWLLDNADIAAGVAGLYLTFAFKGAGFLERYVFSKKAPVDASTDKKEAASTDKPFLLKWTWVLWNLLLSVFSFYGTYNVTPVVLKKVKANGLQHTLCTLDEQEFYYGPFAMAIGVFCLSKGPELIDTAFLLFSGKKKLPFLQWFHHVTTFLYCWHAYAVGSSALQFAASLNYSVHTIMYFYFAMAEAGFKSLVKPFGIYITLLQIAQMLIGTSLISAIIVFKVQDHLAGRAPGSAGSCAGTSWSVARVQSFIAGVNLILFTDMFLKAYVFKKKKPTGAAKKAH